MSALLFLVLLLGCCGYALVRGDGPERVAAGLQVGAFALGLTLHRLIESNSYATTLPATMVIDLVLLAALIALTRFSTRFYPFWLGTWQGAAVVAHLAKLLDPGMLPTGYGFQTGFWAYPMLIATAAGTWRHRKRVASGDPDPGWRSQAS